MIKEDELQQLGHRIKLARTRKRLTQIALAHKLGKDQPSLNRVENGKMNPSYFYLLEVCEGLGISLTELLSTDIDW